MFKYFVFAVVLIVILGMVECRMPTFALPHECQFTSSILVSPTGPDPNTQYSGQYYYDLNNNQFSVSITSRFGQQLTTTTMGFVSGSTVDLFIINGTGYCTHTQQGYSGPGSAPDGCVGPTFLSTSNNQDTFQVLCKAKFGYSSTLVETFYHNNTGADTQPIAAVNTTSVAVVTVNYNSFAVGVPSPSNFVLPAQCQTQIDLPSFLADRKQSEKMRCVQYVDLHSTLVNINQQMIYSLWQENFVD